MKKALRIFGIIAVVGVIIAAIVASMTAKPTNAEKVWDVAMTKGDINAKNYFIVYSDLVCPYCVAFENAIVEHEEEFEQYLADNDILFEVRLSDFLYEYGETKPTSSRNSALGAYCAKNEGKFWDYYSKAISTVWKEFFKSSGKSGVGKMSSLGKDYWIDIGKKVGLGDDFATCVRSESPLSEIEANAEKSAKLARGMPYFKFNDYTSSGFDLSWGWDYVLAYFQSGLEEK
ncbi:MAG: thioredoxin domain-containing protein [Candidatus Saccharimonadaceae bacterium]|nr:thioredoxin domain-containing protein [Candidatus Saccharimonadaceae bacterium]